MDRRLLPDGAVIGLRCARREDDGEAERKTASTTSLTGQKQFITNAGFADLFIVYAKVDGNQFSTFIVERTMPA